MGTGRCILEAMSCGKPAYVCGPAGTDGWVTPELYPALEADGFSGRATERVVDEDTLRAEIQRFDLSVAEGNRDLVRLNHDAREHCVALAELLGAGRGPARGGALPSDELARLVRLEWLSETRANEVAIENKSLRYRIDALARENTLLHARTRQAEQRLVEVRAARAELDQRLAQLQRYEDFTATRRYRMAVALARPIEFARRLLDRLRSSGRPNGNASRELAPVEVADPELHLGTPGNGGPPAHPGEPHEPSGLGQAGQDGVVARRKDDRARTPPPPPATPPS